MNGTHQFITRVISLALVGGCMFLYQQKALSWEQNVQENQAEVSEVEAYNQEIDTQQAQLDEDLAEAKKQLAAAEQGLTVSAEESAAEEAEPDPDVRQKWEDGEWTGSGEGFGGQITVTVATAEDMITDIQVVSATEEDESYLAMGIEVIEQILSAQSAEVDTISGATFSSAGIREAVQAALAQAEVR